MTTNTNEQDRSNCCNAAVTIGGHNSEGTHYYVCSNCNKPCDLTVTSNTNELDELLAKNILVDLKSVTEKDGHYEATVCVTCLKADVEAYTAAAIQAFGDKLIPKMVDEFLRWKLPEDFSPDAGISFTKPIQGHDTPWWPSGTNLLNATQATKMFTDIITAIQEAIEEQS